MINKTYTIKQIREMIAEHQEQMNIYQYLDCAEGFAKVHQWLQEVEDNEAINVQSDYQDIDVMAELNG